MFHKSHYGHFFCHVFHRDYIVSKGADAAGLKAELLQALDRQAPNIPPIIMSVTNMWRSPLADVCRRLNPGNRLGPGSGHTSRKREWAAR